MQRPFKRLPFCSALAASLLWLADASTCAHAMGTFIDIQLVDRSTGATLPVYKHKGQYWLAGQPGVRYAIQMRNKTSGRALAVMSVDGVNIVSGETAAWEQTGYVLEGNQSAQITGWRKSDSEVAAFHFTALPNAYASRTGRPQNVGVIGIAVFLERDPLPPPPPVSAPDWPVPQTESAAEIAQDRSAAEESRQAPPTADVLADSASRHRRATERGAQRLGTGHGAREHSQVSNTDFERATSAPVEIITVRYDSRENLIAMGVLPAPPRAPQPNAFPQTPSVGYVPDPPRGR
ncbi:MAG: hypothetical protein LBP52_05315 [Burkholderiaceae bacterium]|nr:hypothetical protein [Burkholderiaceae bacterium]